MSGAVEIFISFHHGDGNLLGELKTHLKPWERSGLIEIWHRDFVEGGMVTVDEINEHFRSAYIILLLISSNYIGSDDCFHEMTQAIERHKIGTACVIPILIGPIADYWKKKLIEDPQLPLMNKKPLRLTNNRDNTFASLAGNIIEAIKVYNKSKIYKSLLALDYRDQTELFHNLLFKNHNDEKYIGAFLIHGSVDNTYNWRGYSIRSFLTRLINISTGDPDANVVPIPLFSPTVSSDVNVLFYEIAKKMHFEQSIQSSREEDRNKEIIALICKKLQENQNVIIAFCGIEHTSEDILYTLIKELWIPLANAAHNTKTSSLLLMLLVDYSGRVQNWQIPCEHPDDQTWKPIRLPSVTSFSSQDLKNWMDSWSETLSDILPTDLMRGTLDERVQSILGKSNNGNPDRVIGYICERCNFFIGGMESWLKL